MKQIPTSRETSYVDQILPELVWLALINEAVGYVEGARILEDVAIAVDDIKNDDQDGNFALASSFHVLDYKQRQQLTEELEKRDRLRYNMEPCKNPLHKWHLVPKIRHSPMHPDFMYRSAKYVTRTYELFDEKMGITSEVEMPVDYFLNQAIPPDVADDSAGDGDS